ncbi:transglycosylase SLT domain-containing protein [Vibrio sp. R78045]|uniref:transglycosylase SLT domain-containing protein n=1 Tax=Vibrio sp. R78045 TaxID=3093868 RepID=UPI0036F2A3B2
MDLPIDNEITVTDVAYYEYLFEEKGMELAKCTLRAARHYKVHPDYIFTIAKQEAGTTGEYNKNKDGTHDVGKMQINYERWAVEFLRLGFKIDWARVLTNLCDNVLVGTKIIEMRQKSSKNALTAMANYHYFVNGKNPKLHYKYKGHIEKHYLRLQKSKNDFINDHFLVSK